MDTSQKIFSKNVWFYHRNLCADLCFFAVKLKGTYSEEPAEEDDEGATERENYAATGRRGEEAKGRRGEGAMGERHL